MKAKRLFIAAAALCCVMTSCLQEDDGVTPYRKGAVTVNPDWSARTSSAAVPANYLVAVGSHRFTLSGTGVTFPVEVLTGTQRVYIYNQPAGMTITHTDATKTAVVSYNTTTLVAINEPGWLFAYAGEVQVGADGGVINAPMVQQVRELNISLQAAGGIQNAINSVVSASLTGVSSGVELDGYSVLESPRLNLAPVFEMGPSGCVATARLFGIIPGIRHDLVLNIKLKDGTSTQAIAFDLDSVLADFNTNKSTPKNITITLDSFDITGQVTGWNVHEGYVVE